MFCYVCACCVLHVMPFASVEKNKVSVNASLHFGVLSKRDFIFVSDLYYIQL